VKCGIDALYGQKMPPKEIIDNAAVIFNSLKTDFPDQEKTIAGAFADIFLELSRRMRSDAFSKEAIEYLLKAFPSQAARAEDLTRISAFYEQAWKTGTVEISKLTPIIGAL
jgi:hypothetical protein